MKRGLIFLFFIVCSIFLVSATTTITDNSIVTTGNITALFYSGNGGYLTNVGGSNSSWNETYANGLYISDGNLSIFNGLVNNISYLSTYNATYDATTSEWNGNKSNIVNHTLITFNLYNSTWDNNYLIESLNASVTSNLTTLYTLIGTNHTLVTFELYNSTWDNKGLITSLNTTTTSNLTTVYGLITSVNDTIVANLTTVYSLISSNNESMHNFVLAVNESASAYTDYVNTTAGAYTLYVNGTMKNYVDTQIAGVSGGNATWNQSYADTLYVSDGNLSLIVNDTSIVFNLYNSTWDNKGLINSLNLTTTNNFTNVYSLIEGLNSTTISNLTTLYGLVGTNHTAVTFELYNSTWDNKGLITSVNDTIVSNLTTLYTLIGTNHTLVTFELYNSTWDNKGLITSLNTSINTSWSENYFLTKENINFSTNDVTIYLYGNASLLDGSPASGGINIRQANPEGKMGIWWDSYDKESDSIRPTAWMVAHFNSSANSDEHSHWAIETLDNTTGTPSVNTHFAVDYGSTLLNPVVGVYGASFLVNNLALFNTTGITKLTPYGSFDVYPNSQSTYALRVSNVSSNLTISAIGTTEIDIQENVTVSQELKVNSGNKFCLDGETCSKYINYNGTNIVIQG